MEQKMNGNGIRFFATNREMEHLGNRLPTAEDGSARDLRIRLQQGGYYFVDMAKYMPYYFGEVDAGTMPIDAIVASSERDVFADFLANPKIGRVVVCVHGFNVHLFESHIWFRVLAETISRIPGYGRAFVMDPRDPLLKDDKVKDGELAAFIGFSWPSNGNTFSYNRDQMDAVASAQPLAGLLSRLHVYGKTISLLCHSMGNYVACNMLQALVNKTVIPACFSIDYLQQRDQENRREVAEAATYLPEVQKLLSIVERGKINPDETVARDSPFFIDKYVMVAADVERRHVTKAPGRTTESNYVGPFYSGLQHLVGNVTNLYSRFDGALSISTLEKRPKSAVLALGDTLSKMTLGMLDFLERNPDYKWEARLGTAPHPSSAPPNFSSVNATELAGRPIDHSDHIDSSEIAREIARAIGLQQKLAPAGEVV
jgi:hypothetical protein